MSKPLQQLLFDAQIHCACAMPHLLRLREGLAALVTANFQPIAEAADDLLCAARELSDKLEAAHDNPVNKEAAR